MFPHLWECTVAVELAPRREVYQLLRLKKSLQTWLRETKDKEEIVGAA
jgi:hypothetical protein